MEARACVGSAFALITAIVIASAAMAADLPKEGTYSGTYTNPGTFKNFSIDKERAAASWEADGLTVGTGFLDHTTWHCFGLFDVANGLEQWHGYCVVTDPAGDQLMTNVASDKHASDVKSYGASGTFTAGSGKYAGIGGDLAFLCRNNSEFRTSAPGTYVFFADMKASYKLP